MSASEYGYIEASTILDIFESTIQEIKETIGRVPTDVEQALIITSVGICTPVCKAFDVHAPMSGGRAAAIIVFSALRLENNNISEFYRKKLGISLTLTEDLYIKALSKSTDNIFSSSAIRVMIMGTRRFMAMAHNEGFDIYNTNFSKFIVNDFAYFRLGTEWKTYIFELSKVIQRMNVESNGTHSSEILSFC